MTKTHYERVINYDSPALEIVRKINIEGDKVLSWSDFFKLMIRDNLEFVKQMRMDRLIRRDDEPPLTFETTDHGAALVLNMLYHTAHYKKFGMKTFDITKNLFESLMLTDMDSMPAELVRCPFPSFYISIPVGGIKTWDNTTGIHETYGIYVTERADVDNRFRRR